MVRNVRVRKAWKRQTVLVAQPVTIIKPNGERFTIAPTRKRVARRKATAKSKPKRVATLPPKVREQDARAIALEERQQAWIEKQREIDRKLLGEYN